MTFVRVSFGYGTEAVLAVLSIAITGCVALGGLPTPPRPESMAAIRQAAFERYGDAR